MAQFQVVEEFSSLGGVGGTCALCNASKRVLERPERIITTNLVTDMKDAPPGVWPEQYMEFCESCVTEMAQLLGMLDQRGAERLVKHNTELQLTILDREKQIDDLRSTLAATDVIRTHLERNFDVEVG